MKPHLKRAKGSWRQGKGHKNESARAERQYTRVEIQEQLNHDEAEYLERYHKGARTRNQLARLTYRVTWWEDKVAFWTKHGMNQSFAQSCLADARRELQKYLDKKGQV